MMAKGQAAMSVRALLEFVQNVPHLELAVKHGMKKMPDGGYAADPRRVNNALVSLKGLVETLQNQTLYVNIC